ncbi:MAG: universal stress protein [Nitrospirae bacterium]|nr:universal stress protein [Nitrospirota bacterium]
MKKILIAVDDTKGSKTAFEVACKLCSSIHPETTILVYVEKFEGRSLITEMLGDSEITTLRDVLHGTEYQEALDKKAQTILSYYKKVMEDKGIGKIKTVVKKGHPVDEILKSAKEEGADMIVIGSRGKRASHLFMGSVSREVANSATVPVLIVR